MNKLGDYINIKTGKRDANEACSNGGYPFFTCAKEPSRIDFWSFDCECVLVAGNCNPHVSYYNGKFNAYQRVYVIQSRDKKLLNIKYLYYFLKKYMTLVLDKQRGAIEKFFCLDDFTDIKIHLPDLPTQLRIAAILGSIDEKIELNRKKIAELEALAKTIYDYWFVQFDFPDKNGKPYKSSGGKMVWNEQLKREIPEGWEAGTVGELGEIVAGGTPSTDNPSYWSQDGIAWITPKDLSLTNNKYIRHGEHDISEEGLRNSSAQLMPSRSVLLSTRAPIGYIAIADCDICTNQGFKSIVPNGNYGSEFIYYSLSALIPYIKTLGVGSTFAEVSKSALSVVQLVFPMKEIVMQFENVASQIGNSRRICELATEKLIRLRDTLLPLLMNGQVEVK